MEGEFRFSDDLFEGSNTKEAKTINKVEFTPKICTPEWYVGTVITDKSTVDDYHLLKFEADLLYYKQDYEGALVKYFQRLQYLTPQNKALLRDVYGSVIRCYLKLERGELAEHFVQKMLDGISNPADSTTFELAYKVSLFVEKFPDAVGHLLQAIDINPWNAANWLVLYQLFEKVKEESNSTVRIANVHLEITDSVLEATLFYARFSSFSPENSNAKSRETTEKIASYSKCLNENSSQVHRNVYNRMLEQCNGCTKRELGTFFPRWFPPSFGNFLNRRSDMRSQFSWLQTVASRATTKFVIFRNSTPLCLYTELKCCLCVFEFAEVKELVPCLTNDVWPRELLFLGEEMLSEPLPWFAINITDEQTSHHVIANEERFFARNRVDLLLLSNNNASVVSQAKSMFDWLNRYQFCATCGTKMFVEEAGYKQSCEKETCSSNKGVHNTCYPRTDPVVIMAITSADDSELLLGRKKTFPKSMFSCLAGFVEPGECVEDAVVRETKEESGIDVTDVKYVSSQPWPFPSSLMIGCSARATSRQIYACAEEMEDVRWFPTHEVSKALRGESSDLILPPEQAVAYRLVKELVEKILVT